MSISRAAAAAFASGSLEPRTLQLPPVPCRPKIGLKYCGAAGANSVFTFFQSRSNSSARIVASAVEIPWPIPDLSISRVTESLGAICTHAFIGVGLLEASQRGLRIFRKGRSRSPTRKFQLRFSSDQKIATIQARGGRHVASSQAQAKSSLRIGKRRRRLPVAMKTALQMAGTTTGSPGSPMPVGSSLLGTT
jgi:hypothetical protein